MAGAGDGFDPDVPPDRAQPASDRDVRRYGRSVSATVAVRTRLASALCTGRERRDRLARRRLEARRVLAECDRLSPQLQTERTAARAAVLGKKPTSRRRSACDGPGPSPDLRALHAEFAVTRDRRLRNDLMEAYDGFALGLARRFMTRRESPEDLAQVARIGLLHALDRFNPDRERPFLVFARPTILGELKRHVRDRTWTMHVPRSLQEQYLEVMGAADELVQELGRSPRISEVAARARLSEDQVLEARELHDAQHAASLDLPKRDGFPWSREPAQADPGLVAVERRELLRSLMVRLPERDQEMVRLRFVEELTQSQIGARVGVSQMCVSRHLARAVARLRDCAATP